MVKKGKPHISESSRIGASPPYAGWYHSQEISGHVYSSQLLDDIKTKQQVEPQQLSVCDQYLDIDRTPTAYVKLNTPNPTAP